MPRSCWNIRWRVELRRRLLNLALLEAFRMRQSGSQMETNNRRYSNMDTSRRDMLLASLLATLPAMVVSEAVTSPINPAQTIIQPPADHHWVSNKNYPERSVDMCPLAGSLTEPGLYLTLVRWWPGYMSAPHTYVTDRLCVVVSGTWWCNSGDDFDPASCVPVPAGSFVRRVAGTPHYDGVIRNHAEPAIIAICGMGPVGYKLVDPSKPGPSSRSPHPGL